MYVNPNRLLIVDNDPAARSQVRQLASRLDYDVEEADSVTQALNTIQSFSPSFIILDPDMPDSDGIEMLTQLAENDCTVAILILTSLHCAISDAAKAVGVEQGLRILGNIAKPLYPPQLGGWLKVALSPQPDISARIVFSALENDEFSLHYQPTLSRTEGHTWRITGLAAYVRWTYPGYGLLNPAQFLTSIEKSGLLPELTERIMLQATLDAQYWQARGLSLTIGICVPWYLIADTPFPEQLKKRVKELGIDPGMLQLNISDVTKSKNYSVGHEKLVQLGLIGFGLAYDCINDMRSSIVDMVKMPFTVVNLDESMVSKLDYEQSGTSAIRSVIAVAQNLDLVVHAKGVTHKNERRVLESLDCCSARGHLFSPAMHGTEVEGFVRRWNKQTSPVLKSDELGPAT